MPQQRCGRREGILIRHLIANGGTAMKFRFIRVAIAAISLVAQCLSVARAATQEPATTDSPATYAGSFAQVAAPDQMMPEEKKQTQASTLEKITVTGSLIPQAKIETASPLITITAQDIERQGFRNVYEALRALPIASGSVQDSQFTGGFTPTANAISLFALDPSFTLTLINGRPIADFPLPFNGSSDITDLANLPVGLIDHIDVLTGAQSSIYGSSAMAGVVNIVLKDKVDGTMISVRGGGYSDGGGSDQRVQIVSGFSWDRLDLVYGLELTRQQPIFANQRSGLAFQKPGDANPRDFLILDEGANVYIDPGQAACTALGNLFNGTLTYSARPGRGANGAPGYYCGSPANGYNTLLNRDRSADALLSAKYHLSDNTVAYAQILYDFSEPAYSGGLPFWDSSPQPFYDQTTGRYELWQRIFAPEEIGGFDGENQHVYTHAFNASLGLRGNLGDSNWAYDAYYNRSQINTDYKSHTGNFILGGPLGGITNYYLGPQIGTDANGVPIYAPDPSRLYTPITPQVYDQLIGFRSEHSLSWSENFTATVNNTALFSLPAGDVGAAAIAQYGIDQLHSPPDPNSLDFEGGFLRSTAAGSRNHYSLGAEFRIPITHMLTADASGRYDDYSYSAGTGFGGGSNSAGKFTYKTGLEFRPVDELLLRSSYATAFRTPDLYKLFQGVSSFATSVNDWYQCRLAGFTSANIGDCPNSGISVVGTQSGSTTLKDLTAKSFSYGFVWSPFDNRLNLSIDYSRVSIQNEVRSIDLDAILQTEANCRIGHSEGGQAFDINSPTCQHAFALIQRNPPTAPFNPNQITSVIEIPINIASEYQSGIQASARYNWKTDNLGDFQLGASYFVQLKHTSKEFPGDATFDDLCCNNNDEFFNTFTANATWDIGKFSTTLHGVRYAPTWASDSSARNVGPWIVYSGSVKYQITPDMYTSLIVNNITNKGPPKDPTNGSYPYYDTGNYNAYGRAYWLEFGIKFGGSGS